MKNKRNYLKLALDAAMVIVLALLYRKQAISMAFHEIAGLALIGVFFIHIALNGKWVQAVSTKLFAKTTPAKARLLCIVDALLLVSFVLIGVSGVLISKVLFSFQAGGAWKTVHYFCAALSILLMGVHLGLHSAWIGGMLQKLTHLPRRAGLVLATVLTVVICAFGIYSFAASSFGMWITMPFSASQGMEGEHGDISGKLPDDAATVQDSTVTEAAAAADTSTSNTAAAAAQTADTAVQSGHGPGNGLGEGRGEGHGESGQGGAASALSTFAQFFSMTYLVAAAVALAEKLCTAVRRKKGHPAA